MKRRAANWLLRRPRNLAIVAVAAVGALLAVAVLFQSSAESVAAEKAKPDVLPLVPDAIASLNPIPTEDPVVEDPVEEDNPPQEDTADPLDSADPAALTTAMGFVSAWLDTDDPNWPAIDGLASKTLVSAMATTDPSNVPEGEVTDAEAVVISNSYYEVDVLIGEDDTVSVELSLIDRWRVTNILP